MSTQVARYQHSGRWSPLGVVMPLLVMGVLSVLTGLLYSILIHWNPFVYVSFIATFVYCFGIGWLSSKLVKVGRVRQRRLSFVIGFLCGAMALYTAWVAHSFILTDYHEIFFLPADLIDFIVMLGEYGSWGFGDTPITGFFLVVVWLIEAGLFLFLPALIVFAEVSDTPYCEEQGVWLEQRIIIDSVALLNDEELKDLAAGELQVLLKAQVRCSNDLAWMRLTLKYAEQSEATYTLSVAVVHLQQNKDGQLEEHVSELSDDLLIDHEAFTVMKGFAEWHIKPSTDRLASSQEYGTQIES